MLYASICFRIKLIIEVNGVIFAPIFRYHLKDFQTTSKENIKLLANYKTLCKISSENLQTEFTKFKENFPLKESDGMSARLPKHEKY